MAQEIMTLPQPYAWTGGTFHVGHYKNGEFVSLSKGGLTLSEANSIAEKEREKMKGMYQKITNIAGFDIVIIGEEQQQAANRP